MRWKEESRTHLESKLSDLAETENADGGLSEGRKRGESSVSEEKKEDSAPS
jgi:hypothetical protein